MKRKTWKAVRGSVTLLLVLILIPMMTFSAVIVDTSRINMARSMVSSAGDLTMNTALANYDTILKDVYGLFAMSQGKTDEELAADLKTYFQETLVGYGVVSEEQSGEYVEALIGDFTEIVGGVSEVKTQNLMDMTVNNFTVARQTDSALSNPDVLRKQIVEYMKYRAPINLGMSFLDSLKAFKSVEEQNAVVETQVKAQESTQDVTSACKKLIKLIREFDDLIESIEEGDKLVKGSAYSTDGVAVQIKDYPAQVDKYASIWGQESSPENYTHTNLINLVFLAKAPSSNVYLKGLGSMKYIGYDSYDGGYYVIVDGSGVPGVSDASSLGLDDAEAKTLAQVNALNTTGEGSYQELVQSYAAFGICFDMLDPTSNYESLKYFTNEAQAIDYYNQYVGFLQNINQDVKYSDIQSVLKQIQILGQYYNQYVMLIDGEIAAAYSVYQQAQGELDDIEDRAMSNSQDIYNAAHAINVWIDEFLESDYYEELGSIPGSASSILNDYYDEVNPQLGYDYSGYYDRNYTSSNGTDDVFVKALKDIGNYSYSGKEAQIAKAVKDYYNNGESGSLLTYVTNKVKGAGDEPLYRLVKLLYESHKKAKEVLGYISAYNQAMQQRPAAIQKRDEKKGIYDGWVTRKAGVVNVVNPCLQWYKQYVDVYQDDVIIYDKYMQTAQNIVTRETAAINGQFTKIKSNIDEIIKKLTAIEEQIGVAKVAIKTYDDNVDAWEQANNNYQSANQKDSFSKQNASDIASSREQYREESLEILLTTVTTLKSQYNDFYTRLTDDTHFKYGSSKLDVILDHTTAKSAVSSAAAGWTELVISAEFANGKFTSLYNTEATPALEPDFWCFLKPTVRPIQILKYLNETYPEEETLTEEQKTQNEQTKTNYEDAKSDLTGEASSIEDDTPAGTYGYAYKGKTISKSGLPSADHEASGSSGKEFKAKEGEEDEDGNTKVETEQAMSDQKSALSSVLDGIENVISTGVENLYILTYLFENFSYNTVVQDKVIKNADINGQSGALTKAIAELGKAESVSKVTDNLRMLSNFPINATHNKYFGGEIEYVLYGNTSATNNVKYTKASIYALRFGFNCIYAFTDSTIRTTTMSVGLSVQAATLGVVPYQLVQVVLQLALAAAESAIDLQMMNNGLKVAVIKSKQTWALSLDNVADNAKAIAEVATNELTEQAQNAIMNVTNGLQNIVDAGVDDLEGAITDLQSSLPAAATNAANEIIDAATSHIIEKVEDKLNRLQYEEMTAIGDVKAFVSSALSEVKSGLSDELYALFPDNEIAKQMIPKIMTALEEPWSEMETEMLNRIDSIGVTDDLTSAVIGQITNLKVTLVNAVGDIATAATKEVASVALSATEEIRSQLSGYITQAGEELSEEAAKAIKDSVTELTNSFLDSTLDAGGNVIGGGLDNINGASTSSVASIISFGYKDYLMLFCFIQICATPDVTLTRMADLIQLNIDHASTTEGAKYKHANYTGETTTKFQMKHAWTYLTVSASVDLDMLFMNLDIFANMVADDETTVDGAFTNNAEITYNGLLGY